MSLANLSSPMAVKKAIQEYDALGRDRFLKTYGFGEAREYMVNHAGQQYDSKAIAGVAHKYEFPNHGALTPESFSGGVAVGGAARKLHDLGFEIIGISENKGWALWECESTVSAYFTLLNKANRRRKTNKASIFRAVAEQLNGRTAKAVEYKFQNIEKILQEEDLPRIGMSTKANYQNLLRIVVLDYVTEETKGITRIRPVLPPVKEWDALVTAPPRVNLKESDSAGPAARARGKVAIDDAHNCALGTAGEEYILKCEQNRLCRCRRADLAAQVKWAAKDDDGLGYDILSYEETGAELYVEVKTTNAGCNSRFFITDNELAVARHHGDAYRLYRLFHFNRDVQMYVLKGPLDNKLDLKAKVYSASCLS